jgi:uncharacterized protein (DUF4415 family)
MNITQERLAEIKAFKNTDFSDCPELTEEQLKQLKPSHYRPQPNMANFKPIKKAVQVRLDADVLEWLKSSGKGYQTRMNLLLRRAMAQGDLPTF